MVIETLYNIYAYEQNSYGENGNNAFITFRCHEIYVYFTNYNKYSSMSVCVRVYFSLKWKVSSIKFDRNSLKIYCRKNFKNNDTQL